PTRLASSPSTTLCRATGQRVHRVFELAHYVANQHALRISTGRLNEVLHQATMRLEPPTDKGERLRIYYGTQSGVKPPTFVLFVKDRKSTRLNSSHVKI